MWLDHLHGASFCTKEDNIDTKVGAYSLHSTQHTAHCACAINAEEQPRHNIFTPSHLLDEVCRQLILVRLLLLRLMLCVVAGEQKQPGIVVL